MGIRAPCCQDFIEQWELEQRFEMRMIEQLLGAYLLCPPNEVFGSGACQSPRPAQTHVGLYRGSIGALWGLYRGSIGQKNRVFC